MGSSQIIVGLDIDVLIGDNVWQVCLDELEKPENYGAKFVIITEYSTTVHLGVVPQINQHTVEEVLRECFGENYHRVEVNVGGLNVWGIDGATPGKVTNAMWSVIDRHYNQNQREPVPELPDI